MENLGEREGENLRRKRIPGEGEGEFEKRKPEVREREERTWKGRT